MTKPYLLIVTGMSGAGKTTFAAKLADEIFMPLISRDKIKEGYVHTLGQSHTELPQNVNKTATDIFFDTLIGLINNNISVIAEAAFQHGIWSHMLEQFMEKACIYLIICKVDNKIALERFVQRGIKNKFREYFHGDKIVEQNINYYEEPRLNVPTFYIDTSNEYTFSIEKLKKIFLKQIVLN